VQLSVQTTHIVHFKSKKEILYCYSYSELGAGQLQGREWTTSPKVEVLMQSCS